jgi:hypothetical protein
MSAADIAKELIRIANTHGLSRDVIDLMEKKLALLAIENAELKAKVAAFEIEVRQFRSQLQHPKPVRELPDAQRELLSHLMQNNARLMVEEIA